MKVHWHPAYVAYVFNAYTAKAILPDGKEILLSRKTGDVFYSGPVTHRIANTGTTPIHNLIVELKEVNPQYRPDSSRALSAELKGGPTASGRGARAPSR